MNDHIYHCHDWFSELFVASTMDPENKSREVGCSIELSTCRGLSASSSGHFSGFTLIEILVAMFVFAIMGLMMSSILYRAFDTRSRVNEKLNRLDKIELAVALFSQDTEQFIARGIMDQNINVIPPLVGETQYVEFTRGGIINPKFSAQKTTLERVAYLCKNNKFIRRTWSGLDGVNRSQYREKVLLSQLSDCFFAYISKYNEVFPNWRAYHIEDHQKKESIPSAIQLNLNPYNWGKMSLLFILAPGFYG